MFKLFKSLLLVLLLSSNVYGALADNLTSYWKMDEASGNALDAHGSNNLTDNSSVGSASGKINGARDFEGLSGGSPSTVQWFSHADNSDLSVGDIDFTIQLWVNLESKPTGDNSNILNKWDFGANSREYIAYYNVSNDRFEFRVSNDGNGGGSVTIVTANNLGAVSTGTWYLIHVWHDASANQIGIAVNAGTADTASHSTGVFNGTSNFEIGALSGGTSGPFDGLVDEVGIWKRLLTSLERTDLYNSGNGRDYAYITGGSAPPTNFMRRRLANILKHENSEIR